jgi:hypothetical protein
VAKEQLEEAEANLIVAESLPENTFFESLDIAEAKLCRKMRNKASEDCECAGECGLEQYTQLFYVDKTLYKAIANVEYNRHDKTYYYVDGFDFKIELVQ